MTLLSIAQDVAALVGGINRPETVIGSSANEQLGVIIQRAAEELASRHDWTALVRVHTFTPVAASEQVGSIPADFDRFAGEPTMWIGAQQVDGPIGPGAWAHSKAQASYIPFPAFRIMNGNLWFTSRGPYPSGPVSYEYQSRNFVIHADGSEGDRFTADSDKTYLPERLIRLYAVAWWKHPKGFDYAEDMSTAERELERIAGADAALGPIVVDGDRPWPPEPYTSSPTPSGPINAAGLHVKASSGYVD